VRQLQADKNAYCWTFINADDLRKKNARHTAGKPKIGAFGAACRPLGAARLAAITHIGCMYADEESIGKHCDACMT
jgi:hypothetical protein